MGVFPRGSRLRKSRVIRQYHPQYELPIEVTGGEKVTVGREDDDYPGWKWCRAADGREGWIPVELLSCEGQETVVRTDYSSRELSVKKGEDVEIEEERHEWLFVRYERGERGWIPTSHVELS